MKFKLEQNDKLNILLGVFIAALVAANLLGVKITEIFGIRTSVGVVAFPITFLVTDVVAEVCGKRKAKSFVLAGVISLAVTFMLVLVSVKLPAHPFYEYGEEYKAILSSSLRMILASLIAFAISQFHDVWAFHFWKEKTKGRFLWLRNNLSTIISQFIDTIVFMFVAFYGISDKFTASFIFSLIIPYWLLKVVFAVIDTPFVYLGARWLRNRQKDNLGR